MGATPPPPLPGVQACFRQGVRSIERRCLMDRKWVITAAVALTLAGPVRAQEPGGVGVGIIVGDPTGLTLKGWLDGHHAFDVGVGFSGDAAFYADYLWHAWNVFPQPNQGKLGLYVGLGPRVETQRDPTFGIRTVGGLAYWLADHPVELFL